MKKKPISRRADLNAVLQRGLEGSDLVAYQHSRLLEVCAHAAKEVLFYKDRLSAFSSRRTFSTQLWQTIPILSRRKLAENSDAILAKSIPTMAGSSRSTFTSGSSGQPLKFEISHLSDIYSQIAYRRYFEAWNIKRGFKLLTVRSPRNKADMDVEGILKKALPGALGHEYTSFTLEVDQTIAAIRDIKPDYLRTFPSVANEVAQKARRLGLDLHLKLVMTVGETITPETKAAIRECLNCDVADAYAAEELQLIAYQCPRCGNYHCTNENLYVELLNDKGGPVGIGEVGRVVITTLNNFAMPLIRYELEDFAMRGVAKGRCGRRGTLIKQIMGRRRNMFRLLDGRSIWPSIPSGEFYRLGIELFTFVQKDLDRLKFSYTATEGHRVDPAAITELVHTYLDPSFKVEVALVDEIRPRGAGKLMHFESKLV